MKSMKAYSATKESQEEDKTDDNAVKEEIKNEPKLPMNDVCSSDKLDSFFQNTGGTELKVSYPVPECEPAKFCQTPHTGNDIVPVDAQV